LPVTEEIAATNIALPMSPVLADAQASEVVAALASVS
jgi:dTDP-4-amino-4,6-dideoxygalactose transaminase